MRLLFVHRPFFERFERAAFRGRLANHVRRWGIAWLALVINALGWFSHRQWHRSLLGMAGPTILLLSLYPWFQYGWSSYATYLGIGVMLAISIWDLVSPANRRCGPDGCEPPAQRN